MTLERTKGIADVVHVDAAGVTGPNWYRQGTMDGHTDYESERERESSFTEMHHVLEIFYIVCMTNIFLYLFSLEVTMSIDQDLVFFCKRICLNKEIPFREFLMCIVVLYSKNNLLFPNVLR